MKLRWQTTLTLSALLLVVICAVRYYFKYAPRKNSSSKHFIKINGVMSQSLVGKIHPRWIITYATTLKKCDVTYNHIEGVVGWREKKVAYVANPSNEGKFQLKLPIDGYLKGPCHWLAQSVMYCGSAKKSYCYTDWAFYPCGGDSFICKIKSRIYTRKVSHIKTSASEHYQCTYRNKRFTCPLTSASVFKNSSYLNRNLNYSIKVDYKMKK